MCSVLYAYRCAKCKRKKTSWENFFGTWIAYLCHLNKCSYLPCLINFETFTDKIRPYLVVWICSSVNFRADCQKQTLSRQLPNVLDFGLWGFYLPTTLDLKPMHCQTQEISPISVRWMWLLLFLFSGLGNSKTEHEFQRCSWRGACMHTLPPSLAQPRACVWLQKLTETESSVVMAPT